MTRPHQDQFRSASCATRLRKLVPALKLVNAAPDMRLCEPVSVTYRAGLRHVETEIGKWRAETDARKPPTWDRKPQNCRPETSGTLASGVGTGAGRHLSL